MAVNFIGDDFGPIYHYQYRLILIGDSTVGKSSLLRYFTEGRQAEISDPTVGVDFYARLLGLDDNFRVKLQLWDTAGQEKFRSITRSYYRNSAGVLLVYDISSRESFEHIPIWLREAKDNLGGPNPDKCAFILVGHKADMEQERQVLHEEGEYFAKYHNMRFIETSAITGMNVLDAFLQIALEIKERVAAGELRPTEGWEGVKSGVMRSQSLSLSESSRSYNQNGQCSC